MWSGNQELAALSSAKYRARELATPWHGRLTAVSCHEPSFTAVAPCGPDVLFSSERLTNLIVMFLIVMVDGCPGVGIRLIAV